MFSFFIFFLWLPTGLDPLRYAQSAIYARPKPGIKGNQPGLTTASCWSSDCTLLGKRILLRRDALTCHFKGAACVFESCFGPDLIQNGLIWT